MMKKILAIPIFAALVVAMSFSVPEVYAASIVPSSLSVPLGGILPVSGTGFAPGSTIYIFLDGVNADSVLVDSSGSFNISFQVPTSIAPGPQFLFASSDPITPSPISQLVPITITAPSIPEFPFSFSLVIIFVAVSAVYIAIRQKMIPNLKPF